MNELRVVVTFGLLIFVGSCGTPTETKSTAKPPTYYADVEPIAAAKCVRCHTAGGIAPMPLTSYDEAFAYRGAIAEEVEAGRMPPWLAARGHRAYKDDFSLLPEEKETILSWVRGGGLAGTSDGTPAEPVFAVGLPRVDLTLSMKAAYTPLEFPDDYRCFVIDTTHTTELFVTGFDAKPGNPSIVHHIIAYLAYPQGATSTATLDNAEAGDGYSCFGGPGRIGLTDYDYTSVGGWAPGASAVVYPEGTGIRVPPGSKIVMQVHYNSTLPVAPDQTSLEMMTAPTVAKEGFFIPWLNLLWMTNEAMPIPAGEPEVQHGFEFDPTLFTFEHTPIVEGEPFRIYSAQLHMHMLGKSGDLYIRRTNGEEEILLEIPHWDFHWQRQYYFEESVRFEPGDRLGIRCAWDNSQEGQPWIDGKQAKPVTRNWGEGSEDEMCVGFFYTTAD